MPFWGHYEPSRPRAAKGGIQATSKRGAFGSTWWGRRWMQTLESFGIESRLTRGRAYARGGQVLSIDIAPGEIRARVQGSRPKPYTIRIGLATLDDSGWARIAEALRAEPLLTARLLAGEMPEEIERVFQETGTPLFPAHMKDLDAECSCPDWENPCKHLAAVYCLLAEEFDRDPFQLLALRGRNRDALLKSLGEPSAAESDPAQHAGPPEPLPADPKVFWEGERAAIPSTFGPLRPPAVSAPFVRQLGPFPMWRVPTPIAEALAPDYGSASGRALDRIETMRDIPPEPLETAGHR